MNGLRHLERWIEQLVEEPFVRLFAGRLLPHDVAHHLVQALEDGEEVAPDGTSVVPGRYEIALNPADLTALEYHHPNLERHLAAALAVLVERINLRTTESPGVILVADPDLPAREVRITPAAQELDQEEPAPGPDSDRDQPRGHTQDLDPERLNQALQQLEDQPTETRAYLIIQGQQTLDLTKPIVRIGRALDNDVILEERQVSRHHALLRRRYGRYILQDLDSSGGTTVNGFSVQEIVLRPGDLISLSGVDVIYAESEPLERDNRGETRPFTPVTDD